MHPISFITDSFTTANGANMNVKNAVAFVTGANRGFGLALVHELLARGAKKVYAGVRDPNSINIPGVIPVKLDVTSPADAAAAAEIASDTTLLINNAGIAEFGGYFADDSVERARRIFEVNFFGPIYLSRAFALVLKANGGGAIINILSVASWIAGPLLGTYAASKSAAWSFNNTLRLELAEQGTKVLGLHVGFMDTDMAADVEFAKTSPALVASATLDGLEADAYEVLADDITHAVKQGFVANPPIYTQPR